MLYAYDEHGNEYELGLEPRSRAPRPRRPPRQRDPEQAAEAGKTLLLVGVLAALVAFGMVPQARHAFSRLAPHAAAGASTAGTNVALGQRMAARYGWTAANGQFQCLNWLWTRESGWSQYADNSTTHAYGIAQALGHGPTNQYPAGPANPPTSSPRAQIAWGLGYIGQVYVTPCGAWHHEETAGWY